MDWGNETVKVTGTTTGVAPAVEELTVIFPWYMPGPKPEGLTVTETFAGVVFPAVPTESQFPPEAFAVIVCADG
jgi:hypothetical protein